MHKTISVLALVLLITGCAHPPYEPIIDTRDVDMEEYQSDLDECRGFANLYDERDDTIMTNTIVGAGLGAAAGGIAGGAGGDYVAEGITAGLIAGGTTGHAYGESKMAKHKRAIVKRCLKGRGYKVLG